MTAKRRREEKCSHNYERRRADGGAFYWLCPICRKRRPRAKDPLAAAYMARDGISEEEASEIATAVRGVLS